MQLLEGQTALPREQREPSQCAWAEAEYADFISAVMRERGVSYRDMERKSEKQVTKSRLGRILNEDRAKRSPIKLSEVHLLLNVLNVDYYQAAISIELIKSCPPSAIERFTTVALMLSTALRGLPERILELTNHIDGLEVSDITPQHGLLIQEAVLKKFEKDYRGMVERRANRLAQDDIYSY